MFQMWAHMCRNTRKHGYGELTMHTEARTHTLTHTFQNPIKPGLWDLGPTCQMALSVCTSSTVCDSWQQDYGHERRICGFRPSDSILLARRKRANVSSAVWWLMSFDPRKGTIPRSSLFFMYLCAAEVWSHLCVCIFVFVCVCVPGISCERMNCRGQPEWFDWRFFCVAGNNKKQNNFRSHTNIHINFTVDNHLFWGLSAPFSRRCPSASTRGLRAASV